MVPADSASDHDTVVAKKEFAKIPFIGGAMKALEFVLIDRKDRAKAKESLEEAARFVQDHGMGVWIAPEGTRSRQGGLQDFKLGPFHLALATGAPLVPAIMRGVDAVAPMGSFFFRPGTVRLDFLPPIPVDDWPGSDLRARVRGVREVFLDYLPPAPGSQGYAAAAGDADATEDADAAGDPPA